VAPIFLVVAPRKVSVWLWTWVYKKEQGSQLIVTSWKSNKRLDLRRMASNKGPVVPEGWKAVFDEKWVMF
jgi:hypothetical protein